MLGQLPKLIRLLLKKAIFMLLGLHFILNKSALGKEKLVELHSNPLVVADSYKVADRFFHFISYVKEKSP